MHIIFNQNQFYLHCLMLQKHVRGRGVNKWTLQKVFSVFGFKVLQCVWRKAAGVTAVTLFLEACCHSVSHQKQWTVACTGSWAFSLSRYWAPVWCSTPICQHSSLTYKYPLLIVSCQRTKQTPRFFLDFTCVQLFVYSPSNVPVTGPSAFFQNLPAHLDSQDLGLQGLHCSSFAGRPQPLQGNTHTDGQDTFWVFCQRDC